MGARLGVPMMRTAVTAVMNLARVLAFCRMTCWCQMRICIQKRQRLFLGGENIIIVPCPETVDRPSVKFGSCFERWSQREWGCDQCGTEASPHISQKAIILAMETPTKDFLILGNILNPVTRHKSHSFNFSIFRMILHLIRLVAEPILIKQIPRLEAAYSKACQEAWDSLSMACMLDILMP